MAAQSGQMPCEVPVANFESKYSSTESHSPWWPTLRHQLQIWRNSSSSCRRRSRRLVVRCTGSQITSTTPVRKSTRDQRNSAGSPKKWCGSRVASTIHMRAIRIEKPIAWPRRIVLPLR